MKAYEEHDKQAAFENACDCLYYGMGKKYWKEMNWNMDLPEKESDDIWENAFRYMAEGKI